MKSHPHHDLSDLISNRIFSHLVLNQRRIILEEVKFRHRQTDIAERINVSPTTVSRELKRNRIFLKNHTKRKTCKHLKSCKVKRLCEGKVCKDDCKNCPFLKNCESFCPDYSRQTCVKLDRFPYVCDGCPKIGSIFVAKMPLPLVFSRQLVAHPIYLIFRGPSDSHSICIKVFLSLSFILYDSISLKSSGSISANGDSKNIHITSCNSATVCSSLL